MCMFGTNVTGKGLNKKPPGILCNCPGILQKLNRQCDGKHFHVPLMGGVAHHAQKYPPAFCKAVIYGYGLRQQLRTDEAMQQFAAHLPEEIAGVRGHAGCEEATTFLQHQFTTRKGVIITLDYSQCYDRLQVAVATLFLQQLGWPEALVAQLLQVWSTTRFLEFEQHVHPETLQGRGIPQGCPIAPICLSSSR